jgi:hypothetical protein
MGKRRPVLITVIALLQIVPVVLLPPKMLRATNPLFLLPALILFGLLAWALLTWRPAGRTMTIFVQGFNIIVRALVTMSHVVPSKVAGTPADLPLLITFLVSIAISVLILFYVDQPEMQLLFEA